MLNSGEIYPNTGNSKDHLWKVVCGKGNHSRNRIGVLKYRVADWLETTDIEHCADMEGGVFLIRLTKNSAINL